MATEFIRVATESQISLTAALASEIWHEHYTAIIGLEQVRYMLARFQSVDAITAQIDSNELIYFNIYDGGYPAGYLAVQLRTDELFLSKLYVKSPVRNRGLGRKAVRFIQNIAAENCLKRITLTINKHNSMSLAAYERLGFARYGEVVTDIGDGYAMDDYLLEYRLK